MLHHLRLTVVQERTLTTFTLFFLTFRLYSYYGVIIGSFSLLATFVNLFRAYIPWQLRDRMYWEETWPIVGTLPTFYRAVMHGWYDPKIGIHAICEKMGPDPVAFAFPIFRGIWVFKSSDYEHIWKTDFTKANKGGYYALYDILLDGIFNTNGERWVKKRKTASHLFSYRRLSGPAHKIFEQNIEQMCKKIKELTQGDNEGKPIDMHNMFGRLTLQSFCEIAFGSNINLIERAPENVPFATAFDSAQRLIWSRFANPTWVFKRLFGLGSEGEMADAILLLNNFLKDVIKSRNQMQKEKDAEEDLLTLFLRENPNPTQEQVQEIVMNFLIAGRDTTMCMLSWCIYELDKHPEILEKILEELSGSDMTEARTFAKELPYLEAFCKEILRLHPSVPQNVKLTVDDITMPSGLVVPKGSTIIWCAWSSARLECNWEDAKTFKPERFLNRSYTDAQFTSFNISPRLCLGKRLALVEVKMCLAHILTTFRFKVVKEPELPVSVTLAPLNLMCSVELIENEQNIKVCG